MALYLPDKYIWDFWFIRREDEYHLFYLQAARTPDNPDLRHSRSLVGHAVSYDLINWEIASDALQAGPAGSWDDRAIWTGCVFEHQEDYYLFYTGTSRTEDGRVQRIGLARSGDLVHWERHPGNPILEADPRWYEKNGDSEWREEAWRDPDICYDPTGDQYFAFICARINYGPVDGRGAIGLACSDDLIHWEGLPPAYTPGEFTQMEVPQIVSIKERYYLLFSITQECYSATRIARLSSKNNHRWGTYGLVSDKLTGGYIIDDEGGLLADETGTFYAGKIIMDPLGELVMLATRQWGEDGAYLGALSDPMPVTFDAQGRLHVAHQTN